MVLKILVI